MKKTLAILALLVLVLALDGAEALISQYNIIPFDLDTGARPLSLGNAFAGAGDDVNSVFYNPGSLPWAKGITVTLKDLSNISAGEAYPTGYGSTWGLAVVQKGYKDLIAGGQNIDFSSNTLMVSFASRSFPFLGSMRNFGLGLNVKTILGESLRRTGSLDRTAKGTQADLGLFYRYNPWLDLGLNAQNLLPSGMGGDLIWDNGEKEDVPFKLNAGLSARIIGDARSPLYMENNQLLFTSDYGFTRSLSGLFSCGLEWGFKGKLFLRTGYVQKNKDGQSAGQVSYGAGFRSEGWGIDLASYADPISDDRSIYFSVLYFPQEWVFEKKDTSQEYPPIGISDPYTLTNPIDNLSTYDDRIWVRGKVKPGVELFINNHRAYVDENLNFETLVLLNPGKNLILIDSFHEGGKLTSQYKVFRKARVMLEGKTTQGTQDRVETLVTMGVVEVTPGEKFKLGAPVKRGELVSWLVKAANLPLNTPNKDLFSDVPKTHPQAPFIQAAVSAGLIKGFSDGAFRPDQPVTRSEAQAIFRKFGVISK